MDNKELEQKMLQKAQITTATGGQLSAEQYNTFINTVIDESDFLKIARVERGIRVSRQLHLLGLAKRLLQKPTSEGSDTGLTATGATIGLKTLTPGITMALWDVTYDFLYKNIAKENIQDELTKLFAMQFSNDLVDLAFNGDSDSVTPFLALNDGYIKLLKADGDVHNDTFGESDTMTAIFGKMLKALPSKFAKNRDALRFFVSPANEDKFVDELVGRNTNLGDQALVTRLDTYYKKIKLEIIPDLPDTEIILTPSNNLAIGLGEEMKVQAVNEPRKRIWEYTGEMNIDFSHVIGDAAVIFTLES